MKLTPQEQAVLSTFDQMGWPKLRFQQIGSANLDSDERIAATRALVAKGILSPLADGEYWLTERGVELLPLS